MTNREKFAEQILDIACCGNHIAVTFNGEVVNCETTDCEDCKFNNSDCNEGIKGWSEQEYVEEPPVDWSKVPVDTPILVKNSEESLWASRHFAKFENGTVYAWADGRTSWSTKKVMGWGYAEIAEDEV